MARQRRQFYPNPQLGRLTASEENAAASAREDNYNRAAAAQYQAMRQVGVVDPLNDEGNGQEYARVAL
jgi:hypothetical protein